MESQGLGIRRQPKDGGLGHKSGRRVNGEANGSYTFSRRTPLRACKTAAAFWLQPVRKWITVPFSGRFMIKHEMVDLNGFNSMVHLPFELRLKDFEIAMQDVYDFFFDVNTLFKNKGLPRFDDEVRPAIMSGLLSDMLTASLARHSRSLTQNVYFNGHPDLIVKGRYPNDKIRAGVDGVEIKTTRKKVGALDTHGARDQWMCAFVYEIDRLNEPAENRRPMRLRKSILDM